MHAFVVTHSCVDLDLLSHSVDIRSRDRIAHTDTEKSKSCQLGAILCKKNQCTVVTLKTLHPLLLISYQLKYKLKETSPKIRMSCHKSLIASINGLKMVVKKLPIMQIVLIWISFFTLYWVLCRSDICSCGIVAMYYIGLFKMP